jgi:hypothetical protein
MDIKVYNQILCQFWIMSFCKANNACSLTALSWLYLAFYIISYFICKLSITLHINIFTFDHGDKSDRTSQDRNMRLQCFCHPDLEVFRGAS